MNKFVVHEHHATHLHWDLRIELDGVLVSWAIPKGPPISLGIKRLAIKVEDHPLEYGDFQGTIPKGEYGAGTVRIWDKGEYELNIKREKLLIVKFHGQRMRGLYNFVFMRKNQWLLYKVKSDISHV